MFDRIKTDRRFLLTAIAAFAAASALPAAVRPASAQDAGAAAFIQNLGDRAIKTFSDKGDKVRAKEKFRTLLLDGFDVPYIGRWVLGRYWNVATDPQKQEYLGLFEKMIVDAYAGRFAEYSGETFKIIGVRPEGEGDNAVTTQIVRPSGPPVNVDWRVRKAGAAYKIIDVVVEGVSMGVTQRSEFASVIQTNGGQFDGLLKALRAKVSG
jgi:phospholipid transport system substrate-binding protein